MLFLRHVFLSEQILKIFGAYTQQYYTRQVCIAVKFFILLVRSMGAKGGGGVRHSLPRFVKNNQN
jgi:hypothetical protein